MRITPKLHPGPGIMHHCVWKCVIAILASVLLSVFLHEQIYDNGSELFGKHKNTVVRQMVREQFDSEVKNHLEAFKEMQKTSPGLQHASYKLLAGAPPQEKKLLTVGISSIEHPHGSHLLDTLHSLFQATSDPELAHIIVLVHLSEPDPERLHRAAANISGPFAPHLESRRLLVVSGLLGDSPLPRPLTPSQSSPCEALRSRQREGHALLMNFASQLSEYFLLLEDNTRCAPRFVSAIYWTLAAWRELRWVVLEFSSLGSGQVLHSSDLPLLTSVRLLFPENAPLRLLLANFRFLLGQRVPISFAPDLFYRTDDLNSQYTCCLEEEEENGEEYENPEKPSNPPATLYNTMIAMSSSHLPEYAYLPILSHFQTENVIPGDTYTLVFDLPHRVVQIQVLTGLGAQGLYHLEHGQVELGYEPVLEGTGCAHYVLLGPLVKGKCNQKVPYTAGLMGAVRCVRLLVTARQHSSVTISQINVWTRAEEE